MPIDRDPGRRCDGVGRREALRVGVLTALGLTLGGWSRLRADAPAAGPARSCILIWLDGGPSHLETFDPKPDAPAEVRGPFAPIATAVPGVAIGEHLPGLARRLDRIALVRSMTSPLGEHNFGSHYLLTGYQPTPALTYPSLGAVAARVRGASASALPPYLAVPDFNPMAGAGYLAARCAPFAVGGDPARPDFRVRDLDFYPGITADRFDRRRGFLDTLDAFARDLDAGPDAGSTPDEDEAEFAQAYRLIGSPEAKRAFRLDEEPDAVRDRYGRRTLGQSCLLARRLVERGVPFVTVNDKGWDTHDNLVTRLKEGYTGAKVGVGLVPTLDLAVSALIDDLADRRLLDETLVVVMGEFGRTPKLNTQGGRDHWPRVFSVALAGGGVAGGAVVGRSDALGESPADRPVTPADLARTIYTLLGIDPDREFQTADGRPVRVNQGGTTIAEILG